MKSEVTCPIVPGKSLGAQRGFAATFNWMRNFCLNLSGGMGVTVDRTDNDHPVIRLQDVAASGPVPFFVRYHEPEDGEGQWEIYLPTGCVNVGGTCAPINPAASETGNGHEDDPSEWRELGIDELAGTTGTDTDGNTYCEWEVEVHAKTSAKIWQVDGLNAPARRLFWVGVKDRLDPSPTDEERYKNTAGDAFSLTVARVRVTTVSDGGTTEKRRTVTQFRDRAVDVGDVPAPTGYDLVWYFSVDDGELEVEKVYCLRQVSSVAGMAIMGDQMTEVTDAEEVYCRLESPGAVDSPRQLASVVADPDDSELLGEDYITWLPLYHLKENTVTGDYRLHSFSNVQIYRA